MYFHQYKPNSFLNNFVESIAYVEGNNKGTGFPKTAMSLVFNLCDSFKLYTDKQFVQYTDYRKYWVAGLQTQPTYIESYGESKMIVVQFKTLGAFVLLKTPLHNFTGRYISLDCIFSNRADEMWERLQEAETVAEKISLTEDFLVRQLLPAKPPHEKLLLSIEGLLQSRRVKTVEEICRHYQISRKHLNFLFKEHLGVSPKRLISLIRLQSVFCSIRDAQPENLTDLAYELEYFDQSHFSNDFKRFTGLKPSEYIKHAQTNPSLKIMPHFLPAR